MPMTITPATTIGNGTFYDGALKRNRTGNGDDKRISNTRRSNNALTKIMVRGRVENSFHYGNSVLDSSSSVRWYSYDRRPDTVEEATIVQERTWTSSTVNADRDAGSGDAASPAAWLRKQQEEEQAELEHWERELAAALQSHAKLVEDREKAQKWSQENEVDNNNNHSRNDDHAVYEESLHQLRLCYEKLTYWDKALEVERTLMEWYEERELAKRDALSLSPEIAASWYRLGKFHHRLEQWLAAQRCYRRALELYEQLASYSSDAEAAASSSWSFRPEQGNILISMAGLSFHRGDAPSALPLLQQAESYFYSISKTAEGVSSSQLPHKDVVKCLQHQGLVHRSMEQFKGALEQYQRALEMFEQLHSEPTQWSPEDFETRQALCMDVADMHMALDHFELAAQRYRDILEHDRRRRQQESDKDNSLAMEETPLDGVIWHNLGKIHAQMKEMELATEALERALRIKEHLLGEFHPELAKTLSALGAVYAVTERKAEALQCFQQALLIVRMQASTETDPDVLLALRNIAVLKGEKVPQWDGAEHSSR